MLPFWKMNGKSNYVEACLRRIYTLYGGLLSGNISEEEFETMRRNRFCRLSVGKGAIAMDEACELFNWYMKCLKYCPYFETTCDRSKHMPLMRRCGIELFGLKTPTSSVPPTKINDYDTISSVLEKEKIFHMNVGVRILDEKTLWRFIHRD